MKKILTILAATATMFAFGASNGDTAKPTVNHGADFEAPDFVPGANFIWGYNDNYTGATGDDRYWFTADTDAANIISNYTGSGTDVTIASRPDLFADNANRNYLQVETTGKLYRTVKGNGGSGDFTNSTDYAYSIEDMPIYLDTLVKFTAADSVFGDDALENGDKIAIEYVEHESEGDGDPTVTNFVIRAGYFAQTVIATNYFAAVPVDFDKDAWHRLTVRTFARIDAANHVGFVVYLDGTPLEYEDTVLAGDNFTATGAAANFYKEGCHALYPSFVQGGDFQYSISAAAFSGNGSLDDVVFTTTTPNFITAGESVRTEITLGTGIANVAVTVVGTPIAAESTSTSTLKIFNLPAGTTSFVLSVSANEAEGYKFDETTGITLTDATYNPADDTVTITGASPALTVVGKRDNVYYMDGETKVGFATLTEAFASAPANATIKLGYNYSVTKDVVSDDAPVFVIAKNIVLDLNGKELDGGSGDARALFSVNLGCALTVIDSVSGDDGSIIYGGTFGMFAGNGDTIIGSDADYGPVIIGAAIGNYGYISEIVRGKFSAAENTTADDEFVCGTEDDTAGIYVIADDSTFSLVDDYWVVTTKGGSEPTTYAISWTLTGGTTEATAGDFEENDTIVFTAETGKTLSYVSINGTEIADTTVYGASSYTYTVGTAAATLEVTFTTPATPTYAISWTLTGGTTEATAGDFEENDTILFTAETGKTLSFVSIDGTEIADTSVYGAGSYTYTVDTAAATLVVTFTSGDYPSYIDDNIAYKDAYDTWKTDNNVAAGDNQYATAFLLNIAPDATDQTLEPVSITMEGGKVVISANQTLTAVNGKVYVKVATTLAGLATAKWTEATLDEGKVQVTPGSSDTAGFYKIKVDF